MNTRQVVLTVFVAATTLVATTSVFSQGDRQALHNFTVTDEIGLAYFGDLYTNPWEPITVSPDRSLVAVQTERALLKENRVEDEVRIYNMEALRRFANETDQSGYSNPLWSIRKSTYKEGPIISNLRWQADSSRLEFLMKTEAGLNQLWTADIMRRTLSSLTPLDQDVMDFDVKDDSHFAYVVSCPGSAAEMMKPGKVPAFTATGLSLFSPLMVSVEDPSMRALINRGELWVANGGKPFVVRNLATHRAIPIYSEGRLSLRLSPDGSKVAAVLPVENVPKDWETRFPPPPGQSALRVVAGHQDLDAAQGLHYVSIYATIEVLTGRVAVLTDAPVAGSGGWPVLGPPKWSATGRMLLIPGTFLSDRQGSPPCLAIAVPAAGSIECVLPLKPRSEESIIDVRFDTGLSEDVIIDYMDYTVSRGLRKVRTISRSADGTWKTHQDELGRAASEQTTDVSVKQSFTDPPVLIVTDHTTKKLRTVWDPNPQLKQIRLGDAAIYRWKDETGRDWVGGLYKPVDYMPGHRYPLVIQTHGFVETQFRPSGVFPSAFAARALAAQGIAVLQVPDCPIRQSPNEGPCNVRGYESAVRQLATDRMIDPDRVGIIGFSRTCVYVMQTLTTSSLHFKAALIADGLNEGYLQYLLNVDVAHDVYRRDAESLIGAAPYGSGLQTWFERSPEFNLNKINAPLRVVAKRGLGTLFMWEPYAMLRVLKKPVDLLVINTNEHILTNPGARLASQGGTVDWFRFWLKDEEDPDPARADQYKRWRELRELQETNMKATANKPVEKQ